MPSRPFEAKPVESLLETLVRIGSPTFQEKRRSDFILAWLKENVPAPSGQDSIGNVWVDLSHGQDNLVLLDAHIDTVFPDAEVHVIKRGSRWHARGIFDNTIACASLLLWAKQQAPPGPTPFFLSFTVGEEGEGNLRGISRIFQDYGKRLSCACVVDLSCTKISTRAVGSIRFALQWTTEGGHSWNDFGSANAIHQAASWAARLAGAFPWEKNRNTYNVGLVSGGQGINVIANQAEIRLDVRSINPEFLEEFESWIRNEQGKPDAPSEIRLIGKRPAGQLAEGLPLKSQLEELHRQLGLEFSDHAYSTNANTLLAAGLPAFTTGIAMGGGVHTPDEYLEMNSLGIGWTKLNRLTDILSAFRDSLL